MCVCVSVSVQVYSCVGLIRKQTYNVDSINKFPDFPRFEIVSLSVCPDYGMGLKLSSMKGGGAQNGAGRESGSGGEEEMEEESTKHVVRALYAFSGSNDDEVSDGVLN